MNTDRRLELKRSVRALIEGAKTSGPPSMSDGVMTPRNKAR